MSEGNPAMRPHVFSAMMGAMFRLNLPQRIVLVVALGLAFFVFGSWVMTAGSGGGYWVGYAPLTSQVAPGGLHPWVRLLIWLALIVVWAVLAVWLLRARRVRE
jgi:hypothetical protein